VITIPRTADALAIDPGYAGKGNACACALSGELVSVWFEHARDFDGERAPRLEHVIVEQPQQDGRSWSVPPATLIKLGFEGALLAGLYAGASGATLHTPTVTEWKGAENKVPMHARLWVVLSPAERVVLGGSHTWNEIEAACEKGALCRWKKSGAELYPKSFTTHNLLDAAALLMVAYGRLEKRG
jgi:hypothetical protein